MSPRHADKDLPPKYTPDEIAALRKSWNLSTEEFGQLLGFKDASRTVRALEHGEWSGKPYRLTGAAMKALEYIQHIKFAVDALDVGADERTIMRAMSRLAEVLPRRMRA